MKKLEILYSEICNLYGDRGNIMLLEQCLKKENFIYTSLDEEPYFVKHHVDFIYLGSMMESTAEKVITILKPYKKRIEELIKEGTIFLFTGNALEILGKKIIKEDGKEIPGLHIFDIETKRTPKKRYNSLVLGTFHEMKIVGYISISSVSTIEESPFLVNVRERNGNKEEGISKNHFYGTTLLGPILILNPDFTSYLLKLLDFKGKLPFSEELYEAYEKRLAEYEREGIQY